MVLQIQTLYRAWSGLLSSLNMRSYLPDRGEVQGFLHLVKDRAFQMATHLL